jgi:flagellar biosynthesis protein FliQ
MSAYIICYSCNKWSSGSLDLTSTDAPWMWAAGPDQTLQSDNKNANIEEHASYGNFYMNMTSAVSKATDATPHLNGTTSSAGVSTGGDTNDILVKIHAILLSGSFLVLFPLGIIALRWRGLVKIHWIVQLVATAACLLGLGVAIVMSVQSKQYKSFSFTHQILGIAVVAVLIAQAIFGYLHHKNYKKVGGRTVVSHMHIWTGRIVVLIGMIDGVL